MTHKARLTVPARRIAVLAAAVGLGFGAVTLAHARPEFPISLSDVEKRIEERFQALDTDGNGEISAEEYAAAPARTPHGFHHRLHRKGPGDRGERPMTHRRAQQDFEAAAFDRLDTDGDGLLSREEFDGRKLRAARRAEMRERLFARLDADGSGGLSRDELPDPSRRLAAMDADGDGMVTRAEAHAYRQARADAERSAGSGAAEADNG
ncbi:MAG TPA: hypothetical protein VF210_17970 [Pseudomonadales bacterium]